MTNTPLHLSPSLPLGKHEHNLASVYLTIHIEFQNTTMRRTPICLHPYFSRTQSHTSTSIMYDFLDLNICKISSYHNPFSNPHCHNGESSFNKDFLFKCPLISFFPNRPKNRERDAPLQSTNPQPEKKDPSFDFRPT